LASLTNALLGAMGCTSKTTDFLSGELGQPIGNFVPVRLVLNIDMPVWNYAEACLEAAGRNPNPFSSGIWVWHWSTTVVAEESAISRRPLDHR